MAVANPGNPNLPPPKPGSVGASGGTVGLLHFGVSGDTRPPSCEDTANYPTAIIDGIADQFQARSVEFALDLGDHMYVCNGDLSVATDQMNIFMQATRRYAGSWFMTEGNHECHTNPCLADSQDANYTAFMTALAPISQSPYYSFNVQTALGLATFVVVADNSWDATQANWLDSTLAAADANAKYTIIAKHHPTSDSSVADNPTIMATIRSHKFSLLLTGHSHLYKHPPQTDGGRDLIMGNSGAPLIAGGTFYGYGIIDQQNDGTLKVDIFDLNGNTQVDTFTVPPN